MASKNNQIVTKNHITKKTFAYNRGTLDINFTLRVDIKEELKGAIEICEQFIVEANEEMANMKK